MSTYDQVREDYCWYVQIMTGFVSNVHLSQDQIKHHTKESLKHNYNLFLVPRLSSLVSRLLEEEGVLGDVTISAYNLQFLPIAEDVISLERETAFKELWVVSETTSHVFILSDLF